MRPASLSRRSWRAATFHHAGCTSGAAWKGDRLTTRNRFPTGRMLRAALKPLDLPNDLVLPIGSRRPCTGLWACCRPTSATPICSAITLARACFSSENKAVQAAKTNGSRPQVRRVSGAAGSLALLSSARRANCSYPSATLRIICFDTGSLSWSATARAAMARARQWAGMRGAFRVTGESTIVLTNTVLNGYYLAEAIILEMNL
jgi:hypothetical protein